MNLCTELIIERLNLNIKSEPINFAHSTAYATQYNYVFVDSDRQTPTTTSV